MSTITILFVEQKALVSVEFRSVIVGSLVGDIRLKSPQAKRMLCSASILDIYRSGDFDNRNTNTIEQNTNTICTR